MAIVIEGEKKSVDWGFILGILSIVGIIGVAIVYLFFVNPETVQQLTTTPDQQRLSEFSKTKLRPEEILNSAEFQSLRTTATIPVPSEGEIGKVNPLLPQ
ncbi:MAG: hypothetical protein UX49_C0001G0037 [Candidatus Wolfebacteria bacterium GW2011_GWC2_46_275]|uniref:Uncharacterized protein n=2 Tax=Candidatus Wolfeibacteriota TaxID=1752735 RepID=A0A0G1U8J7_9BACT|nr:MAG: hypothetical protein UX70_C0001G0473 [Candidatus Wolfebacteria bacterium GW2011_GWB1_47_1]KKU37167.1 MAG: hypothetical protein UX49_C0001G0037 [Candidatus Wolfebacteria bacterium GW2011_GWC2_46_275]KKU42673.1 MAG: hypothetical protein UX58_C0001G0105 [Candidatus Wolfebacteria bacterium GW2011_GWB2_46_69]KKU54592.1 MAG: hypothetical protein UX76_C0001G0051 [Candidatus Wolfebacteria bacterium GW2011_GWC1_47_103]KKU59976.1 MAG: hypothetical protein UX83_C0001G0051 [Candidatus Wolfebacteria